TRLLAGGHEILVGEQLQRRVHRARARPPQPVRALGDLLDDLVAVHGPLGEQRQHGRPHVTPAMPAAAPPAVATAGEPTGTPAGKATAASGPWRQWKSATRAAREAHPGIEVR